MYHVSVESNSTSMFNNEYSYNCSLLIGHGTTVAPCNDVTATSDVRCHGNRGCLWSASTTDDGTAERSVRGVMRCARTHPSLVTGLDVPGRGGILSRCIAVYERNIRVAETINVIST